VAIKRLDDVAGDLDPFRHLRDIFVSPAQEDASLFTDPNTQEVSDGQNPLGSLRKLESSWSNVSKDRRYILTETRKPSACYSPFQSTQAEADRTYPANRLPSPESQTFG
jgi:hypothetical protein